MAQTRAAKVKTSRARWTGRPMKHGQADGSGAAGVHAEGAWAGGGGGRASKSGWDGRAWASGPGGRQYKAAEAQGGRRCT